jgi:excisionase family DNA binding protein
MERRKRLLTVAQAAERLGISPQTVRRWADEGLIPMARTPTGHRRFDPDQIEAVAAEMQPLGAPLVDDSENTEGRAEMYKHEVAEIIREEGEGQAGPWVVSDISEHVLVVTVPWTLKLIPTSSGKKLDAELLGNFDPEACCWLGTADHRLGGAIRDALIRAGDEHEAEKVRAGYLKVVAGEGPTYVQPPRQDS